MPDKVVIDLSGGEPTAETVPLTADEVTQRATWAEQEAAEMETREARQAALAPLLAQMPGILAKIDADEDLTADDLQVVAKAGALGVLAP